MADDPNMAKGLGRKAKPAKRVKLTDLLNRREGIPFGALAERARSRAASSGRGTPGVPPPNSKGLGRLRAPGQIKKRAMVPTPPAGQRQPLPVGQPRPIGGSPVRKALPIGQPRPIAGSPIPSKPFGDTLGRSRDSIRSGAQEAGQTRRPMGRGGLPTPPKSTGPRRKP